MPILRVLALLLSMLAAAAVLLLWLWWGRKEVGATGAMGTWTVRSTAFALLLPVVVAVAGCCFLLPSLAINDDDDADSDEECSESFARLL
ncbi:hypothetical protein DFJ73DRAFT_826519 [Zopfochytrium polystomum]|nr:hypothetical protein DFJ73DRAFT_826519 [Zopfochytrium polystomum]